MLNRSVIKISGNDVCNFLQKLITNDIINRPVSYNYLLDNLGRYILDFFVFKISHNELLIDIDQSLSDVFIKKVSFYNLRGLFEIKNLSPDYCILYIPNHDLEAFKTTLKILNNQSYEFRSYWIHHNTNPKVKFRAMYETESDTATPIISAFEVIGIYKDTRYDALGYRVIARKDSIDELKYQDEIRVNSYPKNTFFQDTYCEDKYKYFIPDGAQDLIELKSIPIEFGANELNGISYDKGCFIGQEVLARIKYAGVIRKSIFGIKFNSLDNLPHPYFAKMREPIYIDTGREIGYLCSFHKGRGIAILRHEYLGTNNSGIVFGNQVDIIAPSWRTDLANNSFYKHLEN